jgi:hypothetical protein
MDPPEDLDLSEEPRLGVMVGAILPLEKNAVGLKRRDFAG